MEGFIQYLDDILICGSDTESEYEDIVEKVLQQCVEHRLAVNLVKSKFHVHESIFFRHLIDS